MVHFEINRGSFVNRQGVQGVAASESDMTRTLELDEECINTLVLLQS